MASLASRFDDLLRHAKQKAVELLVQCRFMMCLKPEDDPQRPMHDEYSGALECTIRCFDLLIMRDGEYHAVYAELGGRFVECMGLFQESAMEGFYLKFAKRCQQDMTLLDRVATKMVNLGLMPSGK